jgi:hypothetical protein
LFKIKYEQLFCWVEYKKKLPQIVMEYFEEKTQQKNVMRHPSGHINKYDLQKAITTDLSRV